MIWIDLTHLQIEKTWQFLEESREGSKSPTYQTYHLAIWDIFKSHEINVPMLPIPVQHGNAQKMLQAPVGGAELDLDKCFQMDMSSKSGTTE